LTLFARGNLFLMRRITTQPPQGRHETREIGRKSKIALAMTPSNSQFGAAEAVVQTFLR